MPCVPAREGGDRTISGNDAVPEVDAGVPARVVRRHLGKPRQGRRGPPPIPQPYRSGPGRVSECVVYL